MSEREIRKKQIMRRSLKVFSYVDVIIGFFDLMIALYYRYILPDDTAVTIYMLLGVVITTIGWGGVNYEEIIYRRQRRAERSLLVSGQDLL